MRKPQTIEMTEERPAKRPDPRNPHSRAALTKEPGAREDHSQSGGQVAAAVNIAVHHRDNLGERVQEMVRSERMRLAALEAGYETFAEADDFDVDDDSYDPATPYEEVFAGSIQEDVEARYKEQQEALKNTKAEELKLFLEAMDPLERQRALDMMSEASNPAQPKPKKGAAPPEPE